MIGVEGQQRNVWKSWRSSETPKVELKIFPHSPRFAKSCRTSNQRQQILRWWPRVTKAQDWAMEVWLTIIQVLLQDKVKDGDETKFLFAHQEEWQRRLLLRYGSNFVLMDATTKYAIPLFFVCVHTNVGYKIVAKSLYQNEDNECIAEALNIIKSWNPTWKPKYFMVDYSMAEINAIKSEFPYVEVYICDFHRGQA